MEKSTDRIDNCRVSMDGDGDFWLHVVAPTGREAGICLGLLRGHIVKTAFYEWAAALLNNKQVIDDHNDIKRATLEKAMAERDLLRSALVGLIGADTREDLESMEAMIRVAPGPTQYKVAAINAIHALLDTLE